MTNKSYSTKMIRENNNIIRKRIYFNKEDRPRPTPEDMSRKF